MLVQNTLARSAAQQGVDTSVATAAGANKMIQAEKSGHALEEGVAKAASSTGLDRSAPEYAAGLVGQARDSEAIKLQNLQDEESLAIARAKSARDDRDSKALNDELTYIKQVRKEKQDTLDKIQKQKWEEYKFSVVHGNGGGGGHYNAKNIPQNTYKDLLDDLNSGATTLGQVYAAYPDVDPTFIGSIYKSLHPTSDIPTPDFGTQ